MTHTNFPDECLTTDTLIQSGTASVIHQGIRFDIFATSQHGHHDSYNVAWAVTFPGVSQIAATAGEDNVAVELSVVSHRPPDAAESEPDSDAMEAEDLQEVLRDMLQADSDDQAGRSTRCCLTELPNNMNTKK